MIALLAASAFAAATCGVEEFVQDLNCNDVEVMDEVPVDLTDPECLAQTNTRGIPLPNADYYYDYVSYGCLVPVLGLDLDYDGLGGGDLSLMPDEKFPDVVIKLTCDNCPEIWNRDQLDLDCDNAGDLCDNCPDVYNPSQDNVDGDRLGDACDTCIYVPDVAQEDFDGDGFGDACDNCPDVVNFQGDEDEDDVGDDCDNCWQVSNGDQADVDLDGIGDACDTCPDDADPGQEDSDKDLVGDACDVCPNLTGDQSDMDEDGVGDLCDICPNVPDGDQLDGDFDAFGDACDVCPANFDPQQYDTDSDGVGDPCDDCSLVYDPEQLDVDADGVGDACQPCVGEGWDPGECAEYAARGGASTCGTPGFPGVLGVLAALWFVRRRLLMVPLLAGCGFIPASEREWRLDPDADGAEWPDDCNSDDPSVVAGAPWFRDVDGDGYGGEETQPGCTTPGEGWVARGEDCDDENPSFHPLAPELCDGLDQNCDGTVDEGFPLFVVYTDIDGDGYGGLDAGEACATKSDTTGNPGDCDDTRDTVHPGAQEICDALDNDCDGTLDEALLAIWWFDGDGDGYGDPASSVETCAPEAGYIVYGDDCDDTFADTYPLATEICGDGRDNNCNDIIDDEFTRYTDADGDGFGDPATARTACAIGEWEVDNYVDCDDVDPYVNPAVPEVCDDGIDNDCDETVDICEGN